MSTGDGNSIGCIRVVHSCERSILVSVYSSERSIRVVYSSERSRSVAYSNERSIMATRV